MSDSDKPDGVAVRAFRCGPHVEWAVERDGVLVVNRADGTVWRLDYPAAAVWDLIAREYSYPQLVSMLSAVCSVDRTAAKRLLAELLDAWCEAGFLIEAETRG